MQHQRITKYLVNYWSEFIIVRKYGNFFRPLVIECSASKLSLWVRIRNIGDQSESVKPGAINGRRADGRWRCWSIEPPPPPKHKFPVIASTSVPLPSHDDNAWPPATTATGSAGTNDTGRPPATTSVASSPSAPYSQRWTRAPDYPTQSNVCPAHAQLQRISGGDGVRDPRGVW